MDQDVNFKQIDYSTVIKFCFNLELLQNNCNSGIGNQLS